MSVALLPSHHDPHGSPLGNIDGLHHPRGLVHKGDGAWGGGRGREGGRGRHSDMLDERVEGGREGGRDGGREGGREGGRTSDMIEDLDVPDLLPGHGHVLQQLKNGVRDVL